MRRLPGGPVGGPPEFPPVRVRSRQGAIGGGLSADPHPEGLGSKERSPCSDNPSSRTGEERGRGPFLAGRFSSPVPAAYLDPEHLLDRTSHLPEQEQVEQLPEGVAVVLLTMGIVVRARRRHP